MDDFRVGSVPPSEPYGERHPYDAAARKRQKHSHNGEPEDTDAADTFETSSGDDQPPAPADADIEDYYRPSEPREDDV
jgi:hypothetical protein